jgi:hypothetical protein
MKNPQNTQKQLSYRELISKSDKEVLAEELDLKVQSAKSDLEVTVATTKRDLAVAKKKLIDTMSANPYNIQAEMNAHQAVKALEDGLAYAQDVLTSRFN